MILKEHQVAVNAIAFANKVPVFFQFRIQLLAFGWFVEYRQTICQDKLIAIVGTNFNLSMALDCWQTTTLNKTRKGDQNNMYFDTSIVFQNDAVPF